MKNNNSRFIDDLKGRLKKVKKTRWIRFGIVSLLFFLWVIWLGNYWVLLAYLLLFDIYITLYIPWNWWKHSTKGWLRTMMSWVDSIVYALVLVYFIFAFIGQNYKIPSSSLEKTLLVGDFLWVNKMCYGPRVPQTPLHFPLVQNTLPVINTKSYFEKPQLKYHRLKGFRNIERNDIVVFNYPTGDTIAFKIQNPDYYTICYELGKGILKHSNITAAPEGTYEFSQQCMSLGRNYVKSNPQDFGEVMYRPVDRRENYVKRCLGLPGEYIKIVDNTVYINGSPLAEPKNVQFNYFVRSASPIDDKTWESLGLSVADYSGRQQVVNYFGKEKYVYAVPLTKAMIESLQALDYVENIKPIPAVENIPVYPLTRNYGWTRADYAADRSQGIWIPAKGKTLQLSLEDLPIYERAIKNYEGNTLEVREGKIYINGQETSSYTFKMDYYWMMGDNRDNSLDSRYWGFVPEDHVVGTPVFVLISIDSDKGLFGGGFRWNRVFKDANPDK